MPAADTQIWNSRVGQPPEKRVGAALASSTTITPTHPVHHVTGTSAITTIVPPWTGFSGTLTLIADAAFTMSTGGATGSAIATAVTAVSGQAMDIEFDGSVWYPKISD